MALDPEQDKSQVLLSEKSSVEKRCCANGAPYIERAQLKICQVELCYSGFFIINLANFITRL